MWMGSSIGTLRNVRVLAMPGLAFRFLVQFLVVGRFGTWRVKSSISPPQGLPPLPVLTDRAIMDRAILIRFRRSSLRARFRRSGCSIIIMARGRATSATSMRKRVSDRHLLLRRLQRSHIALLPPGDPAEQPGQRSIAEIGRAHV